MKRRSALRSRTEPRLGEAARAAMSKANPPRPSEPNPGFRPTPPVPAGARCLCGCGRRAVHGDHVVERQTLKRLRGDASDPRNVVWFAFHCHGNRHSRTGKLPLTCLPDSVFEFAGELMGAASYDYLQARWTGDDPRLDQLLDPAAGNSGDDR